MDTKICPKCKINKPKTEYNKDSSKPEKLFYCCKSCDKIAYYKLAKKIRKHSEEFYI